MPSGSADFFHTVVQPTVTEFIDAPGDVRLARLAAITLYHMADYWREEHRASYSSLNDLHAELIAECESFKMIRDIADASKHAKLDHPAKIPRTMTTSKQLSRPAGLFQAPFGMGVFAQASQVTATLNNGKIECVLPKVWDVLEMWERKLHGV